jgi:hypothetical protein
MATPPARHNPQRLYDFSMRMPGRMINPPSATAVCYAIQAETKNLH